MIKETFDQRSTGRLVHTICEAGLAYGIYYYLGWGGLVAWMFAVSIVWAVTFYDTWIAFLDKQS